MRTEHDCGPAALAFAGGWDYDQVLAHWPGGWGNHGNIRDDTNDQLADHRLCIENISGKQQTMVTLTDILGERCPKDKTIVLLHFSHTLKHWVVWHGCDEKGVILHYGDGTLRHYPFDQFVDLFTQSMPNCAYKITDKPPRLSGWQRFRRWILGLIARRT